MKSGKGRSLLYWLSMLVGIPLLILFVFEAITSMAYYRQSKPYGYHWSSTVTALKRVLRKGKDAATSSPRQKLDHILGLRAEGTKAFPSYTFEPHLHAPSDFHHLSNPASRRIVDCNESGFFSEWTSDEIGFRNPTGQIGDSVDYIFLGDSFTEGACESEGGTMAGFFRSHGRKVFNLGRGGSGPLFQLGTLSEYGPAVRSGEVVWFVFTANDLQDLRREKTTALARYLEEGYTQSLSEKRLEVSSQLERFLDSEIERNRTRLSKGMRFPTSSPVGAAFDELEAVEKESPLLLEVANRVLDLCRRQNSKLRIVLLGHANVDSRLTRIVSETLSSFAGRNGVPCLEFKSGELHKHPDWYSVSGPHFNAKGYKAVADRVMEWLSGL
jgi:lysophospholipase L1-like esterase